MLESKNKGDRFQLPFSIVPSPLRVTSPKIIPGGEVQEVTYAISTLTPSPPVPTIGHLR